MTDLVECLIAHKILARRTDKINKIRRMIKKYVYVKVC